MQFTLWSTRRGALGSFVTTFVVLLSFHMPLAQALVYRVGVGTGCTHSTINAAVTSAEMSAGPDTIIISQSLTWTQQAVVINTAQDLELVGRYMTCNSASPTGGQTVLNGAGGDQRSVISINSNGTIKLRGLRLTGGDQDSDEPGGGVFYEGNGILDIADTSITANTAGFGGGIYARGTGTVAELIIGEGTEIVDNTARRDGGGIYSFDIETTIREDNTTIFLNKATGINVNGTWVGGYGGGIHIRACDLTSIVYLGSPGIGGLGVVAQNTARYGGGVAIDGQDGCDHNKRAELKAFSTVIGRMTKIQSNSASVAGGGVYAYPNIATNLDVTEANAYFWEVVVEDNTAPQGSALYLGTDTAIGVREHSDASFNGLDAPPGTIFCPPGAICGRVSGNISASNGRVIHGEDTNYLLVQKMLVSDNVGGELIGLQSPTISDSLLVGNQSTSRLIDSHDLIVLDSTIAGNTIGGSEIFRTSDPQFITSSIFWQPGKSVLSYSGPIQFDIKDIIANETVTLNNAGGLRVLNANPRFVDPSIGDYNLKAASPAVDYAAEVPGNDFDLIAHRRDIDLDVVTNRFGPRDLGALEREYVQPLVVNSEFDANLDTWQVVTTANVASWDASQNATGPAGSGSLKVALTTAAPAVSARKQCIHLPAAGDYTLNGFGKSTGSVVNPGDNVQLYWEFRANGDEACTSVPNRNGTLLLSNTSAWRQPSSGTRINVTPQEWTSNSSLLVFLVVDEGGGIGAPDGAPTGSSLNGWFDVITLGVTPDRIFFNGF